MEYPILSYLIFLPLIGVVALFFFDHTKEKLLKGVALFITLVEFVLSLPLFFMFQTENGGMQFTEYLSWIPRLGIAYRVGLDGLSLWLVLLTTFLSCIAVLACWEDIKKHVKEFLVCILLMETGMVGVFVSLDVFLFYVFWEVMLVPMYFIIGVWGNPARRIYAAIKFVLFTMVGSLLMLVAILYIYFYHANVTGEYTFDLLKWYALTIPHSVQTWLFLAFGLAFAIKVPMFPFHTWLPDAHTEAPTVGSVLLAAVLLKMGTYGFLRYNLPLFPEAFVSFVPVISFLAVVGIIYGALVAMVQNGCKALGCFFFRKPSGVCDARTFYLEPPGDPGRNSADDQPWAFDRSLVSYRGDDLRAQAHPDDRGIRGVIQGDARLCYSFYDCYPFFDRASRSQWFCG